MAATLTQPARHLNSERDRLRRRRDRHARLATDSVMTEVAFRLLARERRDRAHGLEAQEVQAVLVDK
jgi:hypothetical protein